MKPKVIPPEPIIEKSTPPVVETKIIADMIKATPKKRLLSPNSRLAPSPLDNSELNFSQDSSVNNENKNFKSIINVDKYEKFHKMFLK